MEFLTWKDEEEENNHCHFVKPTGGKSNDSGKNTSYSESTSHFINCYPPIHLLSELTRSTLYTCCRDGAYRDNPAVRATTQKRKRAGSRKMGSESYCLASISVTKHMESGKVVASYIATHTNHQITLEECKHLPLPRSIKTEVQTMLANGVQVETVLDGNPLFIMNMYVCISTSNIQNALESLG